MTRLARGAAIDIDEVTLAELHARVDPALVPTLDAYCARAAGRIALMPDVKGATPELEVGMSAKIRSILAARGLYADALFIGRGHIIADFVDGAQIAWRESYADFEAAVPRSRFGSYFAFDHAWNFNRREVGAFQAAGVPVIITVNTAHYALGDPIAQGEAAIRLAHGMAYTPFNAVMFDRMIAATGRVATAGFLIYLADAAGYLGTVAMLIYRSFILVDLDWLRFFIVLAYATASAAFVLILFSLLHFWRASLKA